MTRRLLRDLVAVSVGFWIDVALTRWEARTHAAALATTQRRRHP